LENLKATVTNIYNGYHLVPVSEQQDNAEVVAVMKNLVKIQSHLSTLGTRIRNSKMMMPEIKASVMQVPGRVMSEELVGLLNMFGDNSESIEKNFFNIRH
jgi:hypothetical protein